MSGPDRFSLSNRLFEISHRDFRALTHSFRRAVETAFGQECSLEITGVSRIKPDGEQTVAFKASSPEDVTASQWKDAAYVSLKLRPVERRSNLTASAEFKGFFTRRASFSVTPGRSGVIEKLAAENRGKTIGRGGESHLKPPVELRAGLL